MIGTTSTSKAAIGLAAALGMLVQPLDDVRDYFGEQISFYFGWMESYSRFLTFLSVCLRVHTPHFTPMISQLHHHHHQLTRNHYYRQQHYTRENFVHSVTQLPSFRRTESVVSAIGGLHHNK